MTKGKFYNKTLQRVLITISLAAFLIGYWLCNAHAVYAQYVFAVPQANMGGTVSITPKYGKEANGYYELAGYCVTYTITNNSWVAYDPTFGGYFYVGNNMNPSAGCSFGYAPSGIVQEHGALQLGCMPDGRVVGSADALGNTVSCSFEVQNLDELPTYIAYSYQPASGAYIHLSEELGNTHHIWYYQKLRDTPVSNMTQIDMDTPGVITSVQAVGTSVVRNGITWSKSKEIVVNATDEKSGIGTVGIYQGNTVKKEEKPATYTKQKELRLQVNANGQYQAEARDNIGNSSGKKAIAVNGIDTEIPIIKSLSAKDSAYCRETVLSVEASDSGVGLATLAYSWNGGAWSAQKNYTVNTNGIYTVAVRDALGNQSSKSITIFNIDRNAPVIEKMELEKQEFCRENTIIVTASDKESGLSEKAYSWEKDIWTERAELKIYENGKYTITVKDKVGNTVQKSVIVENVDNEAPVIEKCEEVVGKDDKVTIRVIASDGSDGCGLAKEAYSIDNGKTWQESPVFTVDKNGIYMVLVRDALDNSSSKGIEITKVIDKKPQEHDDKVDKDTNKDNEIEKDTNDEIEDNQLADKNKITSVSVSDNFVHQGEETGNQSITDNQGYIKNINEKPVVFKKQNINEGNTVADSYDFLRVKRPQRGEAEQMTVDSEILLSQPQEAPNDILEIKPVKRTTVQDITLMVLVACMVAGILGLLLYLLLFYLQRTCILYGIDSRQERIKICRLPIRRIEDQWQIQVPDEQLGNHGTGRYVLVFHHAFVKEEMPVSVMIEIAERTIRENLDEEISFCI